MRYHDVVAPNAKMRKLIVPKSRKTVKRKEAVKWMRLAAEQGGAAAQFNLGARYALGTGVPKDYLLAYMWYNIAGANGQDVEVLRVFFMDEISQADIAKAQEMTRQYIKDHPDVY